jgi:hypothetical protein
MLAIGGGLPLPGIQDTAGHRAVGDTERALPKAMANGFSLNQSLP